MHTKCDIMAYLVSYLVKVEIYDKLCIFLAKPSSYDKPTIDFARKLAKKIQMREANIYRCDKRELAV